MYDALHLTELSRSFNDSKDSEGVRRGEYATNESHAVDRQIIRMMLAMPDLVGIRCKWSIKTWNKPFDIFHLQHFIVALSSHICRWLQR